MLTLIPTHYVHLVLVHADITKAPSSGVFLEGTDVTLTCVVEGNNYVLWDDLSDATSIFIGKRKNTEKKKYDNFEISSGDEDFSLIIKDVQLSDEGTYICKDRDQHPNATVTIGVLPSVHLSVKQSEATQASQTSTEVNITCSAYNAKPAVSVFELSVIGSGKTVNITNDKSEQNEDGKTYNSSASVSYIMSSEEMSVYCRVFTAGRSIKHTENFYKPRCNITMSGNEIRCLCQANPQVNTYYMDVNGNNHDGDVLFIEEDDPMNIRCFARNELGTGQSDLLFPDDIYGFSLVPIAVIVSVVVLLVVLTVIYIRCRRGPREQKSDGILVSLYI
ncbi:immunoglobulin light chain variable region [Apostichopus japonicus]|uniref:Immunoglobulin light chain variable region n=1 Tax=Stichopus japonicus TaxID=307972 RepID=A0A2G8LEB8_STIJA|nr:immunoglobulin light chain variable region [Apostichopus japonicus]